MLNILMIASVTYLGMVFFTKYRTPIAVLGSAILLIYGNLSGSFPANLAFQNFPQEIVILIIVLGLFTKIFERSGLFNYICPLLQEEENFNSYTASYSNVCYFIIHE